MTTRRHMLPSALLEEPGSKRTGRDWLVDVAMLLIAIGIGVAVFSPTEDQHSDAPAGVAELAVWAVEHGRAARLGL